MQELSMNHRPDLEMFSALAAENQLIPVYRTLLSDSLTPVSAFQRLDQGGSVCLFESVIGGEKIGRFSILATDPFMEIHASGQQVTLVQGEESKTYHCDNPLNELRDLVARFQVAELDELPPFSGGVIGYAGYDVVRYEESLPDAPHDDRQIPDMTFGFYDSLVVFDNINKTLFVIVMARPELYDGDVQAAYAAAAARVDGLVARLANVPSALSMDDITTASAEVDVPYESNFTPEKFQDAVAKCVEYIEAGDIFQVVISQRLELALQVDPLELYRSLRVVNPSPFMFFLRTPEVTLVGSSPEIMCRVVDGQVTVRPLAGTRPRGATVTEDEALAEQLLADPKERAEHVMLVDLGRNDLGRIASYGSIELSDVMVIERYSHVMHITSNVNGELQEGKDAFDALAACLPAGTVSGAPKVRAMQIIDELEPHRRGPYAGAVGYIDYAGNMDTCIALRTFVINDDKIYIQAGAGIVADSDPQAEYEETLNKARGLLKAVEITAKRARQ